MNPDRKGGEHIGSAKAAPWPFCNDIGGTCLAYEMGRALGGSIEATLLDFVVTAQEGSRLTLQKNKDGFTAQVTGAVEKKSGDAVSLSEVRALRRRLACLTENGPK